MRYTVKKRGSRFNKVHIATGHGEVFVTSCGLRWRRESHAWKGATTERIRPLKRIMNGAKWPELKEIGVTCEHCLEVGYRPFFERRTVPDQEATAVGPEGVCRGQRGGMDVDLRPE